MSPRLRRCLAKLGIEVNVTAPMNATPADLARLGDADFNVVLYPEVAGQAASWLQRIFGQPFTKNHSDRRLRHPRIHWRRLPGFAGVDATATFAVSSTRLPWYSRSVDSTYLTGKRVFHLR